MVAPMSRTLLGCALCSLTLGCGDSNHQLADAPLAIDAATACTPSGSPIMHTAAITADETWAAGIHVVPSTIAVTGGTLTIAPCSEVQLGADASIELSQNAVALLAHGTAASPIAFVRQTTDKPWGHLSAYISSKLDLAYTTLAGGGTAGTYQSADQLGAILVVRASTGAPRFCPA